MQNLSEFPAKIDTFPTLFDLPASLSVKAKRYQTLKMMATLDAVEQEELNELVSELGDYIITPQTMNKFADGMVNLQTFFKTNVDGYINTKQSEWADYVKSFMYVGVHRTNVSYKFQNMVTSSNGDLYLCIRNASTGIAITNSTYWQKISSKGDKGDVGLNTHLKGKYSSSTAYQVGDAVMYQGDIFYCISNTTAGTAPTNGTYWRIYDKMYVSKTAPANTQEGLMWIQLLD